MYCAPQILKPGCGPDSESKCISDFHSIHRLSKTTFSNTACCTSGLRRVSWRFWNNL